MDFQKRPKKKNKYRNSVDDLPRLDIEFFNYACPEKFFNVNLPPNYDNVTVPDREFGVFFHLSDDLNDAKNVTKSKFLLLAYISDSFYFPALSHCIGNPAGPKMMKEFKVSLGHCVNFHDINFDPTQWLFMG